MGCNKILIKESMLLGPFYPNWTPLLLLYIVSSSTSGNILLQSRPNRQLRDASLHQHKYAALPSSLLSVVSSRPRCFSSGREYRRYGSGWQIVPNPCLISWCRSLWERWPCKILVVQLGYAFACPRWGWGNWTSSPSQPLSFEGKGRIEHSDFFNMTLRDCVRDGWIVGWF
jgi:hypothetical protein